MLDTTLGIVLVMSILIAGGALAFAVASPQQGETYTQFMVGSMEDGEFTVGEYPTELSAGESATYTLVLENNEGTPVEYHVLVELQRVEDGEVVHSEELTTTAVSSNDGERLALDIDVRPSASGEHRLAFWLFVDEEPSDVADDVLYVWVTID